MSIEISSASLKRFASACDATKVAPALQDACVKFGIDTARKLTHFLGQIYHESGGFTRLTENLDYSAERLTQVWPKRFPNIQAAAAYAHNPPALANSVYGGRLGNVAPNDGWRYRGRGFIQLTGKDNYRKAGKWSGLDLLQSPDLAADYAGAAQIAAGFWADRGLNEVASGADVDAAIKRETQLINGGTLGLAERKAAIVRAAAIWT